MLLKSPPPQFLWQKWAAGKNEPVATPARLLYFTSVSLCGVMLCYAMHWYGHALLRYAACYFYVATCNNAMPMLTYY